jgi:hypothetical protein
MTVELRTSVAFSSSSARSRGLVAIYYVSGSRGEPEFEHEENAWSWMVGEKKDGLRRVTGPARAVLYEGEWPRETRVIASTATAP